MVARQIGSQYRETLDEAGLEIVKRLGRWDYVLRDKEGETSWWHCNDHVSGYAVEINGIGYEGGGSVHGDITTRDGRVLYRHERSDT